MHEAYGIVYLVKNKYKIKHFLILRYYMSIRWHICAYRLLLRNSSVPSTNNDILFSANILQQVGHLQRLWPLSYRFSQARLRDYHG